MKHTATYGNPEPGEVMADIWQHYDRPKVVATCVIRDAFYIFALGPGADYTGKQAKEVTNWLETVLNQVTGGGVKLKELEAVKIAPAKLLQGRPIKVETPKKKD